MNVSRFILLLLRCIISLIVESMKEYENSGDLDENGIPLSSEWSKQSYMLAALRDCVREIENSFKEEDKNENK